MRFLLLNYDYPEFLDWLYREHAGLGSCSYADQMKVRNGSLFGVADFYSSCLNALGHEAWDVHANNESMQHAWAREAGLAFTAPTRVDQPARRFVRSARLLAARTPARHLGRLFRPLTARYGGWPEWYHEILAAQIRHYRPDVILNHDLNAIEARFLSQFKDEIRLLVGQIASPLPPDQDLGCYDLLLSSLPNFVERFRRQGIAAALLPFAFHRPILDALDEPSEQHLVTFVGSLSTAHASRWTLLEHLCAETEIEVYGTVRGAWPRGSRVRSRHRGEAWGIRMHELIRNSQITLNHHIGVAGEYANNMRLFEATGVGTLLLTDAKVNLPDLFSPNEEVVVYRTPEECVDLLHDYLADGAKREAVATAGQRRTLKDHTYDQRMQEMLAIVKPHL